MSKQTFKEFKRELSKDWALDDANNYDAREFVISVIADYYEEGMPKNIKEFKEWLVNEKGYDEDDAKGMLKEIG